MSQTTNEPGFDTGTPPTQPRKAWHARTWVRVTGAIAALIVAGSFGAAAASGSHTTMTAPPASSAPATTTPANPPAPADPAPATSDPAPAAPSTFGASIGSVLTASDDSTGAKWTVTVNSVKTYHRGEYEDAPKPGTHYVIANVTYKAVTGSLDVNEWDWSAKDSTGQVYDLSYAGPSDTGLSAKTIAAGQTIRGDIVVPIPDSKTGSTVVYTAGDQELGSWAIPAGV
jgi:hypothetical protein